MNRTTLKWFWDETKEFTTETCIWGLSVIFYSNQKRVENDIFSNFLGQLRSMGLRAKVALQKIEWPKFQTEKHGTYGSLSSLSIVTLQKIELTSSFF